MTRIEFPAEERSKMAAQPENAGGRSVVMDDDKNLQNIDGRLSRIEGQIRGIRSMASERRACIDVVTQIAAVRAALKKVADVMVSNHVHQWVRDISADNDHSEQDVEELLKVFNQYYR